MQVRVLLGAHHRRSPRDTGGRTERTTSTSGRSASGEDAHAGRVLITGSAGALGSLAHQALTAAGYPVRGLDIAPPATPQREFVQGTITSLAGMRAACTDVTSVLHLGGASHPGVPWEDCLAANIDGTRTVLEAARSSGVQRVVIASSNHATGFTRKATGMLPADSPIRPDSLYGVSKAAGEALASYYADEFGLQTLSLRIGSCFPRPTSTRMLATWLSPADFVRLIVAALSADWRGHRRVWGVSDNTRRWWSLDEAAAIGFFPEDDAETFADAVRPSEDRFVGDRAPASGSDPAED